MASPAAREIAGDEGEVGGLHGNVGSRADGQAQVGLRQGRRVVHAVSHHGHHPALALQSSDHVGLLRGQDIGDDLGDAHLAGHRPGGDLVVTGQQHRSEPKGFQRLDGFHAGGLHGVGHGEDGRRPAVPPRGDGRLPKSLGVVEGALQLRGQGHTPVGEESRTTHDEGMSVDDAFHAQSLAVGEPFDSREGTDLRPRCGGDRPGDGVLRGILDGTDQPQRLPALHTVGHGDADKAHLPGGDRARLVEHDGVDSAGGLQHLGSLYQDSQPGAATGAHEQRSRGGQSQRARAGDDQRRHCRGKCEGGARTVAEPESQRRYGQGDHDGDEHPGDAVGEALDRCLARLGVLDQSTDLCQRGIGADLGGPDDQPAAHVDRRPDDLVAWSLLDRHRLPRQQRLVDRAGALLDLAVRGDLLAGADNEPVPYLELLDRNPTLGAVGVEIGDVLGAELQRGPQRGARPALRPGLEVPPGQDEGGDHPGRFQIDV